METGVALVFSITVCGRPLSRTRKSTICRPARIRLSLEKNESRQNHQPDWDSDRGHLPRANQGSKTQVRAEIAGRMAILI